jgi:HSP20 family protein
MTHRNRPDGDVLPGFGQIVEKLTELAEKGQEFQAAEGVPGAARVRGVFGVHVRPLANGDYRVESFGNVRHDARTGEPVVHPVREPLIDVFEEPDCVRVVAEMPGVGLEDVKLELSEEGLSIQAARGDVQYHKQVALPAEFDPVDMTHTCHNGVLNVRLLRGSQP